ncbi:MAG: hypothetical protein ICV81_00745 [Flavisolibacter sp.]|nr:hypothetical protein [Flavisolibacter sp.]
MGSEVSKQSFTTVVPHFREDLRLIAESNLHFPQRYYFYGGANEGCNMVENVIAIAELLKEFPNYAVDVEIDPEGEHSEYHWRNKFPDCYAWLSQGM